MNKSLTLSLAASILALGFAAANADDTAIHAQNAITANGLLKTITILSSDDFEGRAPGSTGERRSVDYIQKQFAQIGLKPGNPDGSYIQKVPMVGIQSSPTMTYNAAGKTTELHYSEDYVARSTLVQKDVAIDKSDMVFVGYGVVAPEYGWDDYKGMDLHGKTIVMLINDPAIPDPADPTRLDPHMFKGEEMTYYGRWTYKYEIAAKMGAAAALIVHETKPAAYGFDVVRHSWANRQFYIDTGKVNPDFPSVAGWLQLDVAKALFKSGGFDFDELKKAALSKDFKPVALGVTTSIHIQNQWDKVQSKNVVGKIDGSDPQLKNETIIYSAHWDHLGIDKHLPGPRSNQIFHGALDNASGVAALMELARAYKALPVAPKRSILFIATTSEEQGLLGARYYAQNPLYPLAQTLIDINIDGINSYGRTNDISVIGSGKSTVDELVAEAARQQGRSTKPDPHPEHGSFFRADQFEFAKAGVPGLYTGAGIDVTGKPAGYGTEKMMDYIANHYHSVHDVVDSNWDLSGAVQDVQLLFNVGYGLAQGNVYPQWKPDSEFQRK